MPLSFFLFERGLESREAIRCQNILGSYAVVVSAEHVKVSYSFSNSSLIEPLRNLSSLGCHSHLLVK